LPPPGGGGSLSVVAGTGEAAAARESPPSTAKRKFCPNTAISAETTFYVDPKPWNEENLLKPLLQGRWLFLRAPSQAGKTTRALALVEQLEEHGILPILLRWAAL